jgi:subtilisin family serine protease
MSSPARPAKISPSINLATPAKTLQVWVLFTDKGVQTASNLQAALDRYQVRMSERVRQRRSVRARPGQPDVTDLPIESDYVDAILRIGGQLRSKSRWLNGIGLEATSDAIRAIARLPFVRAIDPIVRHRAVFELPIRYSDESADGDSDLLSSNAPSADIELDYGNAGPQVTQIQADFLHQAGLLGEGLVIGLLDTGFSLEHTALQDVDVIAQYDFVNDDENPADEVGQDHPEQDDHGSIVLGILAANAPGRLVGLAPHASYLLAKTEEVFENGRIFEQQIEEDWWIEGLEWLEEMGADVISSSLGYADWYRFQDLDGRTSKITIAADLAVQKGLPVIIAAGNQGGRPPGDLGLPGRINPPADGFNVLAIGAVDRNGKVAPFSSPGPTFDGRIKPDLMAMGAGVASVNPVTRNGFSGNLRGTSMATPLASGVVTLLLQAFPLATPQDIGRALRTTASQSDMPDNTAGYGIIRARTAYETLLDQFGQTGLPDPIAVEPQSDLLPITLGKLKRGELFQNYPNPFNAETWMPFKLAFSGRVTIRIYDVHGQLINVLQLGDLPAGDYASKQRAAYWNGRTLHGERAASGSYFYVLELLGETYSRKMILLE